MICPDWKPLVAHRFTAAGSPPPGWSRALEHLEGCPACRRSALALDPTLLFRRLAPGDSEPVETERMQRALRSLRRADRVGRRIGARRRRRAAWAAAAALAVALSLLAVPAGRVGSGALAPGGIPHPSPAFFTGPSPPLPAAAQPLVEALDRPHARVYQFGQEDLSLVMIVDESLDV